MRFSYFWNRTLKFPFHFITDFGKTLEKVFLMASMNRKTD